MNDDLKYLIDMINPDIIHTQNLVSMSYWVWKYAKKKDIPVIHTLRDYWLLDPTTIPNTFPLIFDQLFQFKFRGLSNKYVDFVTAPSSRVLEIFNEEGYFKNSIKKTIVNCIDFNKETLFKSIKDRSTRTDTRIRYLYAGKVSDNKGIRILVEAFIESKIDGELIICGNGELTEWINSLNVQNIIQKGKLTQDELHKQYELADVLIVPSLWEEPFGRIIIEGAQYALVTIGSNKGGIPEIIKTLKCGDVYNSNSKEELIELLKKYANRDKLRKIYKEWPLNLDVFSIERQIASFENIYDRMKKGYL